MSSQSEAPQVMSLVAQAAGPVQQWPAPEIPEIPEVQASFEVQAPVAIWGRQLPALQ